MKLTLKYPEKLQEFHMDLPFLPERKRFEKVENLIANIHDKTEYVFKKFKTGFKQWSKFEKGS